ncbi:MAG: nucleotidyltransferase substrate binding protein [Phormidesmis sp.]
MNSDMRWVQRFQNFEDAFATFSRVFERYQSAPDDEIIQIALVQAFEFTFEIAWKTMKDYLEHEGYGGLGNSKQTIRVAFRAELIVDAESWMSAIAQRNMTSHVYNSVVLQETILFICGVFYPLVRSLYSTLKKSYEVWSFGSAATGNCELHCQV